MRQHAREMRYIRGGNLPRRWALLSKARKRYATRLVESGYTVALAIQTAYFERGYQMTGEFERSIMGLDDIGRFEVLRKQLWEHEAETLFWMMTPYCSSRGVFPKIDLISVYDYIAMMDIIGDDNVFEETSRVYRLCDERGIAIEDAFMDGDGDIVEYESAMQNVFDYIDEFANILLEFGPRDPLTGSIEELLDFWEREDDGEL